MTKQDAIDILELNMDMCRFNPLTGEDNPMSKDAEELADACEIAIECVQKCIDEEESPCHDCQEWDCHGCLYSGRIPR